MLARCVAADDRDAFGKLVAAYSDDIRRLLDTLTRGDTPLVDDLAQEVFIKAYLSIRSFKGIARFRTWLYRIAYNEFISYVRKKRPTQQLDIEEQLSELQADEPYSDEIANGIDGPTLEKALEKLPPINRTLIQLFYYDNFSIEQISKITQLPKGTVKSYLSRARQRLAKYLTAT